MSRARRSFRDSSSGGVSCGYESDDSPPALLVGSGAAGLRRGKRRSTSIMYPPGDILNLTAGASYRKAKLMSRGASRPPEKTNKLSRTSAIMMNEMLLSSAVAPSPRNMNGLYPALMMMAAGNNNVVEQNSDDELRCYRGRPRAKTLGGRKAETLLTERYLVESIVEPMAGPRRRRSLSSLETPSKPITTTIATGPVRSESEKKGLVQQKTAQTKESSLVNTRYNKPQRRKADDRADKKKKKITILEQPTYYGGYDPAKGQERDNSLKVRPTDKVKRKKEKDAKSKRHAEKRKLSQIIDPLYPCSFDTNCHASCHAESSTNTTSNDEEP